MSLRSRRSWSCCAGSSASRCSSKLTWIAGASRAHARAHTQHSRVSCSGTIEFDEFLSFFVEPVDMCALLFPAHTLHRRSSTPALHISNCAHITSHFQLYTHHFTFPIVHTSLHISNCAHITSHFQLCTHHFTFLDVHTLHACGCDTRRVQVERGPQPWATERSSCSAVRPSLTHLNFAPKSKSCTQCIQCCIGARFVIRAAAAARSSTGHPSRAKLECRRRRTGMRFRCSCARARLGLVLQLCLFHAGCLVC